MKKQYMVSVTVEHARFFVAERGANGATDWTIYPTRRAAEQVAAKWSAKPGVLFAEVWEV